MSHRNLWKEPWESQGEETGGSVALFLVQRVVKRLGY